MEIIAYIVQSAIIIENDKQEFEEEQHMDARGSLALKIIFSIIYMIGTICVVVFSGIYLQQSTVVPYPDAMLPMRKYAIAAWKLIIGLPFMAASCASVVLIYKLRKAAKIILVSLPAIVCLVMCVSYFILS